MLKPSSNTPEFVCRPKNQLMLYPVEYRWEFTRRNPYYLILWKEARRYYQEYAQDTIDGRTTGFAAKLAMGVMVGVTGEPVSPTMSFESIAGTDPIFLCGSLQPLTIRNIVDVLLGQVSPECQQIIGQALLADANCRRDATVPVDQLQALRNAIRMSIQLNPHLDLQRASDVPLFLMHLDASQETIKQDANRQAKLWKARAAKTSPKVHTGKLADYLEVWDRFEGWADGGYDLGREASFTAIAKQLNASVSTVHDRYCRAFELVIGQTFSPLRWCRTIGMFKVATTRGNTATLFARYTRRILVSDRVVGLVSPTPLGRPVTGMTDHVAKTAASHDDTFEVLDLLEDILALIAAGHSDAHILAELELVHPSSPELVRSLRSKHVDLQSLGTSQYD